MHEWLCGSSAVDLELTETGVAAPCAAHVFRYHRQSIAGLKPRRRRNVPHFFATAPQSGRRPFLRAANVEFSAVAGFYHGLPLDLFPPTYEPRGGYLAFLGRISREKRPDRAIEMASALGMPLKIAAKVDKADDAYFREAIVPLLARPGIEFLGEIGERDKAIFLGEARALLFPIDWPVPFGLVMIEINGVCDASARLPLRFGARDC